MAFPAWIREQIETLAEQADRRELARASEELSLRYREKTGQGLRLAAARTDALAYAASRMPATYAAAEQALGRMLECVAPPEQGFSLLDLGAGTGAVTHAVCGCLRPGRVTCLEREESMRAVGLALTNASPDPVVRGASWRPFDLLTDPIPRADMITIGYVLGELREEDALEAAARIWAAAGSLLLILEPGTPEAFRRLGRIRSLLLSAGAQVAAPCPHGNGCPLPEGDWCHWSVRVPRSRLHRLLKGGDAPYEDEKYCFLALSRTPVVPAAARVLRHPGIFPGRIDLSLCTPSGILAESVRKREKERYRAARDAAWGDAFPPCLPVREENAAAGEGTEQK